MRFQTDLIPATLIRRYKRFLADCALPDGRTVTAHVANPGSMLGLAEPGTVAWLEPNDDPRKKLDYAWRLAGIGRALVGVDTGAANRIVREALLARRIPGLDRFETLRAEVPYGRGSRVDFQLTGSGMPDTYVEVKSATLSRQAGLAEFPDSVTARGRKHLKELEHVAAAGSRAVMLFLVQRNDCRAFDVAGDIDPAYAAALDAARERGVEVLVLGTQLSPQAITARDPMPFRMPDP